MQLGNIGIAGEVRCVVTGADGAVKTDTGFQKNLILNQGLDFFGGGKGVAINNSCAIGSGNTTPAITQTALDAFIAIVVGTDAISSYAYTDTGDGMYRMWEQKKYTFTGLNNVNISEVGLVSQGTTSSDYYLTTRALIKDNLGSPTSISVKTGETLDIYYKTHKVIDTSDKSFVINVLDGNGGAVPYNVVIRPYAVGSVAWNFVSALASMSVIHRVFTGELSAITGEPGISQDSRAVITDSGYIALSNKKVFTLFYDLNVANFAIRVAHNYSNFFRFQMRFGRVSDDAPLTKTANDTLSIPIEFSWGRYEGAL